MAINNKPAEAYAKPHTMSGKAIDAKESVTKKGNGVDAIKMSIGSQVFKSQMDEVKPEGVKQRGHGAATKGFTSRGPMA
jgi:glycerol-3-phosphate dehydrogenase